MKERAPAFQFYPRQFAGDDRVMGMDLEAIGAHILLMCAAAASPERCRIDAEEYAIRMRLRNPSDEAWERIKKQLMAGVWKVSADGKWWVQSGLERTFLKQKEFAEEQRRRANKKWQKEDAESMPDASRTDAESMPEVMPEVCSSSSSSSSSSNLKPYPQTPFADEHCGTADTKNSKPSEAQVEQLYGLYPRKRDKLDAKKAIRKAVAAVMAVMPITLRCRSMMRLTTWPSVYRSTRNAFSVVIKSSFRIQRAGSTLGHSGMTSGTGASSKRKRMAMATRVEKFLPLLAALSITTWRCWKAASDDSLVNSRSRPGPPTSREH